MKIAMWHNFMPPPWGGGNQFLLALKKQILCHGHMIIENTCDENTRHSLINAISFDIKKFEKNQKKFCTKVVHRVDGPVFLIRGFDKIKDDICFQINNEYAFTTIVQSQWMLNKIKEMGYNLQNPQIIHNASDPTVFNKQNRIHFSTRRKIKLISTSWSNNVRKGKDTYLWLDRFLDFSKYEYIFVGNIDATFKNIKVISPVDSKTLSSFLKQSDIYITASKNDPCSNSLVEALSCGLPSICLNDGGHPELVKGGGFTYNDCEEIPILLKNIEQNYVFFQKKIQINNMYDVCNKYLNFFM